MDMKGMTQERFNFLMNNIDAVLTKEEMHNGWHFCPEFDGLLMRVGDNSVGILKRCYCGYHTEED